MTKDSPPTFDDRYDPAFQRGFAGAPSRIHAVAPPKQDSADRPIAAPRREAARPPAAGTGRDAEAYDPFAVPSARAEVDDDAESPDAKREDAEETRRGGLVLRGNPWVATLWVVAVLLLTAGFFGTWRSQSIYVGASPITDMNEIVTFQILQLLSPSLVLVGLLVLGGLLFLHAVSWRARRTDDEPAE
jgi:hypothetical protein